jgi:uncharacterized protein
MTNKELKDLEKLILNKLMQELPKHLYYHSPEHTLRVIEKADIIAKHENVSENDLKLIKIAALFHDIGFIKSSLNHEELGCEIVRDFFNHNHLQEVELDKICGMIMATKIPQTPHNKLEEILADADLEYLGTEDFEQISRDLFKEFKFSNPDLTEEKWYEIQINFIEKHTYFTSYGKKYLSETKRKHLKELKEGKS